MIARVNNDFREGPDTDTDFTTSSSSSAFGYWQLTLWAIKDQQKDHTPSRHGPRMTNDLFGTVRTNGLWTADDHP